MTGEKGSFFRIVVILSKANATPGGAELMYLRSFLYTTKHIQSIVFVYRTA